MPQVPVEAQVANTQGNALNTTVPAPHRAKVVEFDNIMTELGYTLPEKGLNGCRFAGEIAGPEGKGNYKYWPKDGKIMASGLAVPHLEAWLASL